MSASKISPQDYLSAETVVGQLAGNYEVAFQLHPDTMTSSEAVKHFTERQALMLVQKLLIDAAARAANLEKGAE